MREVFSTSNICCSSGLFLWVMGHVNLGINKKIVVKVNDGKIKQAENHRIHVAKKRKRDKPTLMVIINTTRDAKLQYTEDLTYFWVMY